MKLKDAISIVIVASSGFPAAAHEAFNLSLYTVCLSAEAGGKQIKLAFDCSTNNATDCRFNRGDEQSPEYANIKIQTNPLIPDYVEVLAMFPEDLRIKRMEPGFLMPATTTVSELTKPQGATLDVGRGFEKVGTAQLQLVSKGAECGSAALTRNRIAS